MAFFGSERNKQPRPPRVERVAISDALNGYRHANWDPYTILHDIQGAGLTASADGEHLWTSSEQLQAFAATSWLAAIHQDIGHALVTDSEKDGKLPADAAAIALIYYQTADIWHKKHQTVTTNEADLVANLSAIQPITWPDATTSPELFSTAVRLPLQLVTMSLPVVLQTLDSSLFLSPEYRPYNEQITREASAIQDRLQSLLASLNEHPRPDITPSSDTYREAIALTETIVQFGVKALVPVIGDSFYKLPERKQHTHFDPDAFSSAAFRGPQPSPAPMTTSPAFHPAQLHRPNKAVNESPKTPTGPAFNPSAFRSHLDTTEASPPEAFDPRRHRYITDKTRDDITPEPFDSTQYRRDQ